MLSALAERIFKLPFPIELKSSLAITVLPRLSPSDSLPFLIKNSRPSSSNSLINLKSL